MIVSAMLLDAFKMAGIVADGDSLTSNQAADGLIYLNQMLDAWAADGLLNPYHTTDSYSWTSGNASRTIGSTGNFSGTRPVDVVGAYIRSGGADFQLKVISYDDFQAIENKSETGMPIYLAYQKTTPNGTLHAWPVPDTAYTVYITREAQESALTSSDDYLPAPGKLEAVRYNLAKRLMGVYPCEPKALIIQEADNAVQRLQRQAYQHSAAKINPAIAGTGFNIDRGFY